jgi:putative uncharacterized protein ta0828
MPSVSTLFDDTFVVNRIKAKLPHLFQLAELESQRNGKIGMEVGSTREKILIALLMYKFGLDDVNANLPITEPEIDVFVKNEPLSIKTVTTTNGRWGNGVKLVWSVDANTAAKFKSSYNPSCDMMLAQIQWDDFGYLYLFSKQSQIDTMYKIGRDFYMKLPKPGTNARGVELTSAALDELTNHPNTKKIKIFFKRKELDYREVYTKWLDAWHE